MLQYTIVKKKGDSVYFELLIAFKMMIKVIKSGQIITSKRKLFQKIKLRKTHQNNVDIIFHVK